MGLINWDALARRIFGHRQRDTDTGSETGTNAQPIGIALHPVQAGQLVAIAYTGSGAVRTGPDTSVTKPKPVPVAQEIIAYRGWQLTKDKAGVPQLASFNGTRWDGPSLVADAVPDHDNTNGVYALTLENPYRSQYEGTCCVWGSVALSGIVVEGQTGYRAERATIRTLSVVKHPDNLRDSIMLEITTALEDRYQCPVEMDGDRIWHNTPDEELVAGNWTYQSAMTSYVFAPRGYSGLSLGVPYGLTGGRRRR